MTEGTADWLLEIQRLAIHRNREALVDDASLSIRRGSLHVIVGPNGAGKSTLLAAVLGLIPFDGHIVLNWRHSGAIGYVPQTFPVDPTLPVTVEDFLALSRQRRPVCLGLSALSQRTVARLLARVGLSGLERRPLAVLSGGELRRVLLAHALDPEPELLILDEPTIGLDPNQIRQVRELIKNLGRQHTILLSTHILPEVEMTCSRVIIIHKGRIEACDTPDNLLGKIRQAGSVELEAKVGNDNGEEELKKIPGVRDVVTDGVDDWKRFSLRVESGADVREEVFRLAVERRWAVRELTQCRGTLEDVFVELTHPDLV